MIRHLLAEDERGGDDNSNRTVSDGSRLSSSTRLSEQARPSWCSPLGVLDNENFENKRKSLKLTNVRVSIPNASTSSRRPGVSPFTTYIITAEAGGSQWQVRRRYSDFYYMHRLLKAYVKESELPSLPPKKYIGSSTSSAFVEERRLLLERYLRKLVLAPSVWLRSDIVQFLDSDQNILMFTWNFERMRKMQEMLGSMTIENQSHTEMLTLELNVARSEIEFLKERIQQMEMLFLQQATGAAANKLNPSAMRSLSHGSNPRLSVLNPSDDEEDEAEDKEKRPSTSTSTVPTKTNAGGNSPSGSSAGGKKKTYAQALQEKLEADLSKMNTNDEDFIIENQIDIEADGNNCPEIHLHDDSKLDTVKANDVLKILQLAKEEDNNSAGQSHEHDSGHSLSTISAELNNTMSSGNTSSNSGFVLDFDMNSTMELQQRMVLMSRKLQHAVRLSNELLEEKFSYAKTTGKIHLLSISQESENSEAAGNNFFSQSSYEFTSDGIMSELLSFEEAEEDEQTEGQGRVFPHIKEEDDDVSITFGDVVPDYVSKKCKAGWSQRLAGRMDEILTVLIPTAESISERMYVYHMVRNMVSSNIGGQLFPIGSFSSKTFLPDAAIDLSSFLTSVQSESWFVKVNEALCISSMADTGGGAGAKKMTVRNVSFINAGIKVIKSTMNNVEVDISVNQITALYAQALIDKIDNFIGEKHLFKRSCILIKMWCKFESSRHTSSDVGGICDSKAGRLSTWSIVVMTIWIFNKYGKDIQTTLQALAGFLCYFSSFDWGKYAITVHGPVLVEDLSEAKEVHPHHSLPKEGGFIPHDLLELMNVRFQKTIESIYDAERGETQAKSSSLGSNTDDVDKVEVKSSVAGSSLLERNSVKGIQIHSYYHRGLVNVMDPIQPKNNLTRAVDSIGAHALVDALHGGKSSLLKLCYDSKNEMADAQEKLKLLSTNTPSGDPDTIALLAARDIPLMRTFFENSTRFIAERSRGKVLPAGVEEQESLGYPTLKSNQREIELAMKHAELILGNIVTPEALACLIVYVLEVKGPLPVGEVGKILQEATGNENLAQTLKTCYKGLKKVIEGFQRIFRIGTDHPFNPLVSLSLEYIEKRDAGVIDASDVAELFVFEPYNAPPAERLSDADGQFVMLNNKGKASSFKGDTQTNDANIRANSKRSSSFSSTLSVDTSISSTAANTRKPPSARNSPSNRNRKQMDPQGGIVLSPQEYQHYQQYQMHMFQEQQRYQQYVQANAHQSSQQNQSVGVSVLGGDSNSSPLPPAVSIQVPPYAHGGFVNTPLSPPMSGGYFYDQTTHTVYFPSNVMTAPPPTSVLVSSSPTSVPGVALRRNSSDNKTSRNSNTNSSSENSPQKIKIQESDH